MKQYQEFDELIKKNIPSDSEVTSTNLNKRFGSLFVDIHYTVSEEYQKANELWHRKRILSIRLIQDETDRSIPIASCADRD